MATARWSPFPVPSGQASSARHDQSPLASEVELVSLVPAGNSSTIEQSRQSGDTIPVNSTYSEARLTEINASSLHGVALSAPAYPSTLEVNKPSLIRRLLLDSWLCEILATGFSIGCLVAIVVVVGTYDNKRIPQFVSGLTLNTIISVLSTASRSSLVFATSAVIGQWKWCWLKRSARQVQDIQALDDASRGPLGAFGVLTSWIGGSFAAFGSAIAILMIVYSPFIQQLVEYPSRNATQPDAIASAPQNLAYTGLFDESYTTIDLDRILEAGTWSNQKPNDREPTCPTGHCSWPRFQSVGWCSKCEDRTKSATLSDCEVSAMFQNKTEPPQYCKVHLGDAIYTTLVERSDVTRLPGKGSEGEIIVQYTSERIWAVSQGGPQDSYGPGMIPLSPEDHTRFLDVLDPLLAIGRVAVERPLKADMRDDLDFSLLRITEASLCILTLCERTFTLDKAAGVTTWTVESTNFGNLVVENVSRAANDSSLQLCWQAQDGEVDLIVVNEGYDAVDKNKRAFCPVDGYALFH